MHLSFAFVALAAWLGSTAAVTLQTFAPCEDLSPHCPILCASCIEAEKWPQSSHESYEIDVSSEEEEDETPHKPKPQRNNSTSTSKPISLTRLKRLANGWVSIPEDKPKWLPTWVPWWYKPRPSHGGVHPAPPPHGGNHEGNRPDNSHEKPQPQDDKCGALMNGGRQLVEAFCPRSCGRCGKSSSPLAAAKVYIGAQCTVAKFVIDDGSVGLAQE